MLFSLNELGIIHKREIRANSLHEIEISLTTQFSFLMKCIITHLAKIEDCNLYKCGYPV
jgi:LEA14-like dessication related protein